MKIKAITVNAGRTVQHPLESYANLRPQVTLHAELEDGDDPEKAVRELQGKAESLIEAHTADLKNFLVAENDRRARKNEILELRRGIERNQERLADLIDQEKRDATDPTVQMLKERIETAEQSISNLESVREEVPASIH